MDKMIQMGLLLDFYSGVITPRQQEIMDLYYNHDYSLAEISEQLNISRQGVHDGIKKSETILLNLEDKLGFIDKYKYQKKKVQEALEILDDLENENKEFKFNDLRECINEIII